MKEPKITSTTIENEEWMELVKISNRDDRSISSIIRKLIRNYLESEKMIGRNNNEYE